MKKTHIAFLSEHVYSLFNPEINTPFGGGEVDLYNLAVYLAQNPRFVVTFYVGDFGQTDKPEVFKNVQLQKIKMFGWHRKNLKQKIISYSHLWLTLWRSEADIILTEMASHLVGWAAIFFKTLKKKHYIHRLASDKDTEYTKPDLAGGRRIYHLYRYGLKKADVVFSQTIQQQKMLKERMGVDSEIAPNGFFINQRVALENKKYILWVGRCAPVKRAELFVEMAKRIPNKRFMMIMPPPSIMESDDFLQQAESLVEEAKNLPNMTFKGFVPFAEIQEYYNNALLFVNTSKYEGFPNAFIQSCIGGTPIASLRIDPDGFITENKIGISCHDRFEDLLDFVENLTRDQVVFLGRNARKYVEENHDIRMIGGLYEKKIETLVMGKV